MARVCCCCVFRRALARRDSDFLRHFLSEKHKLCYRPSSTYRYRESTMATRSEKSRHREAASSARETARRLAPRRATADRRLRILERLTARLSGAMLRAPRGRATNSADHRREAGEPPPAGFQWQIARIREAMIVARRMMGELQATDRFIRMTSELDRRHDFAPPLAGGRRGSRAARRFGAHPAPPASDQAPVEAGGRGKLFLPANP